MPAARTAAERVRRDINAQGDGMLPVNTAVRIGHGNFSDGILYLPVGQQIALPSPQDFQDERYRNSQKED